MWKSNNPRTPWLRWASSSVQSHLWEEGDGSKDVQNWPCRWVFIWGSIYRESPFLFHGEWDAPPFRDLRLDGRGDWARCGVLKVVSCEALLNHAIIPGIIKWANILETTTLADSIAKTCLRGRGSRNRGMSHGRSGSHWPEAFECEYELGDAPGDKRLWNGQTLLRSSKPSRMHTILCSARSKWQMEHLL